MFDAVVETDAIIGIAGHKEIAQPCQFFFDAVKGNAVSDDKLGDAIFPAVYFYRLRRLVDMQYLTDVTVGGFEEFVIGELNGFMVTVSPQHSAELNHVFRGAVFEDGGSPDRAENLAVFFLRDEEAETIDIVFDGGFIIAGANDRDGGIRDGV